MFRQESLEYVRVSLGRGHPCPRTLLAKHTASRTPLAVPGGWGVAVGGRASRWVVALPAPAHPKRHGAADAFGLPPPHPRLILL